MNDSWRVTVKFNPARLKENTIGMAGPETFNEKTHSSNQIALWVKESAIFHNDAGRRWNWLWLVAYIREG